MAAVTVRAIPEITSVPRRRPARVGRPGHPLPVPGDRRASLADLTGEGRALVARLHTVMRSTEEALTDGLDPDEVQATRRVLAQVAERARTLRAERAG